MKKLALILTLTLFIASCGNKEETQTTPSQDQQQTTQQQTTQQQTQLQTQSTDLNKQDEPKKDDAKKEEEKKNEVTQIKDDDKKTQSKTKDENIKKTEEVSNKDKKTDNGVDIDFAPIFAKRCAKCHGKDLKGKPDGGPDLTRSETQNKSDSKLFNIISNGVKADNEEDEDMPAFKGKFSDDEIKAAIEFIKKH